VVRVIILLDAGDHESWRQASPDRFAAASDEYVSAASAMIARICLMILGCSTAPLWKGTVARVREP
jgi:hypothetical protein